MQYKQILSFLLSFSLSQSCTRDVLVDDFKRANLSELTIERVGTRPGPMRYFNLMGGDWGIKEEGKSFLTVKPAANGGYVEFLADWGPEDTSESYTHPGKPNSHNYVYVKFDLNACFDLSPFTAFEFDLVAPPDAEMIFVMTQKSANCSVRLIDSVYHSLDKYITPDGTKKTVRMPVSDFSKNLLGQDFDLKHLKDFTIIDIKPSTFNFQISNFYLRGNCPTTGPGSTTGSTTVTSGTKPVTSSSPRATTAPASNAAYPIAGPAISFFTGLIALLIVVA